MYPSPVLNFPARIARPAASLYSAAAAAESAVQIRPARRQQFGLRRSDRVQLQ